MPSYMFRYLPLLVTLLYFSFGYSQKEKAIDSTDYYVRFEGDSISEKLKKLTRTEGQILVKLIHRQTGSTAFDLIKELRSGWRAFWYNTTAKAFKISLKKEFNPELVQEDYLIEDILQRAFAYDKLDRQKSVLDYDYASLSNKWKNSTPKKPN